MVNGLHVVLGGTGSVGRPLAEVLLSKGHEVRSVFRSADPRPIDGVEAISADVSLSKGAEIACAGASVVYNCVFPPTNAAVLSACSNSGAKLVLADSLAMYNPRPGPIKETTPYDLDKREFGITRVEMEQSLITAHNSGDVRAAIGRASDVFGPGVIVSAVGSAVFRAAIDGRSSTVMGDPDMPHTYTYNRDFAQALATLGNRSEADGQVWHVPSAQTVTTREFLTMIYKEAGSNLKIRALGSISLMIIGLLSRSVRRAHREKLYQFQAAFVSDHSKFEAIFGTDVTPHDQAVKETLEWFRNY